ncbi:MAG: hypothetical protein EB829_01615 [Nitrosopumilus sp. H8]|nr:MAG: hypothetical protein EB829_01615 [Nitrosopumilus sp. H8]
MGFFKRLLGQEKKTLVSYMIDRHTDEFYDIFALARNGEISDMEAVHRMFLLAAKAGTVDRYYKKTHGKEMAEMSRMVQDGKMSKSDMLETLKWLGEQEDRDLK